MPLALSDLPKFLVLDPLSTVRLEMHLSSSACEIDVELDNPGTGRSFVLLIGHKDGPFVQRVRLAGKARIYFDPQSPGDYVLLLANPQKHPIVLRLKARDVGVIEAGTLPAARKGDAKSPPSRVRRAPRRSTSPARPARSSAAHRR